MLPIHGAHHCARTFVQSAPGSLRQFAGSKSLLPFLGADVMPGIAFPLPYGFYRGSLGPWFPTPPGKASALPRGTVRCYDCLRPSRSVRFWLPSGTLVRRDPVCVPPSWRQVRLIRRARRATDAWVLFEPVTRRPAVAPKETGGSPEFPDYPFAHMPRSETPVVSRPLALARTGLLPSDVCISSALGPVARPCPWSTIIHFSEFYDAACVLASPLLRTPPLGDRTSVRLPTGWLAVGRVGLEFASHPLGNVDMFQEVSPLFSHPEFISARACGWLGVIVLVVLGMPEYCRLSSKRYHYLQSPARESKLLEPFRRQ